MMLEGEIEGSDGAPRQVKQTTLTKKGGWKRGDKIEITAAGRNEWLFRHVVAEKERIEAEGGSFQAVPYIVALCRDGLVFRKMMKEEGQGCVKPVMPRADRYHLDKILGRGLAEALKLGHITPKDLVMLNKSAYSIREEIIKNPDLTSKMQEWIESGQDG